MSTQTIVAWIDDEIEAADRKRNACAASHNVTGHVEQLARMRALQAVRDKLTVEAAS